MRLLKLLPALLILSASALGQSVSSGTVKPGNCATAINAISRYSTPGCTPVVPLLNGLYFSDTTPQALKRGSLMFATGITPRWTQLPIGGSTMLLHGGLEPRWGAITPADLFNLYSSSNPFTAPQIFNAMTVGSWNGICVLDGVKNTTLASAITCAGSSGTIEVAPVVGTLAVTTSGVIPSGVTLRIDQGAQLSIANGVTLTINGAITAGPYQVFSYVGTGTVALGWQEEVRAIWFPGADMIAEIVNAYKAAPAAPSLTKIIVDVNPAGGCWTATTAGVMNTAGKLARIQGSVPPGQAVGNNPAGACINYTPTSGIAFTLDWVPSDGSASPGPGITDLLLTHTLSYTVGGPSTDTSTALSCGSTNQGIGMADFYAFQVKGFNTGYSCATSLSFGMNFYASIWEFNGTAVSVTIQTEYINFIGGHFDGNGTPVSATDTNITFSGVNFDSNTKFSSYAGSANAQITYNSDRFENLNIGASSCGLNSAEYINSSGPTIVFNGGIATDDCNTGTNQDYWFTGNIIQIYGLSVSSAGRTVTNLFVINQRALGFLNNGSAAVLTGTLGLYPAASTVSVTGTGLTPQIQTVQVCLSGSVAAFLTCMQTAASPSGAATVTVPSGTNTTLAGLAIAETFTALQGFSVGLNTGASPPACTAGTSGFWCATEGTAPTNVASTAAIYPDSTNHEYMAKTNGSASAGMMVRSQPSPVNLTAQTALKTTTTLCAASAGACNIAGQYRISWDFWGSGTACSTVTVGSVQLQLTWTDENAVAHTAIAMPMWDQKAGSLGLNFNFNTALGTEGASGSYIISTNGSVIQYATTYTACTTGTGTYNLRAAAERVQ